MRIQGLVDHLALNGLLGVVEKVDAQRGKVRVYMPSYESGRSRRTRMRGSQVVLHAQEVNGCSGSCLWVCRCVFR